MVASGIRPACSGWLIGMSLNSSGMLSKEGGSLPLRVDHHFFLEFSSGMLSKRRAVPSKKEGLAFTPAAQNSQKMAPFNPIDKL